MANKKYTSAAYHAKVALSGLEKIELHLLQAKAALPKKDETTRKEVELVQRYFNQWKEGNSTLLDTLQYLANQDTAPGEDDAEES